MLPQSKGTLAFLIALPLLLVVPLWQAAQKRPRLWAVFSTPPAALALSHDGLVVAFAQSNGQVSLWPYAGNRLPLQMERTVANNAAVYSPVELHFSSDDQVLLGSNIRTSDSTTALYAWDTRDGRINWSSLSNYKDDFCRYWPAPGGKRTAQRSYDVVKVLDISTRGTEQDSTKSRFARSFPILTRVRVEVPTPQALALSPDGNTLVGATDKGRLEFWDVKTSKRLSISKPTSVVGSTDWELQYSPDGRYVALFDGTTISVWDTTTKTWSTTIVASTSSEVALAWMPDSHSLWTGAGTIQQWSVPALKRVRDLPVGGPLAVSGDGHRLVTRAIGGSGVPGGIWMWNIG